MSEDEELVLINLHHLTEGRCRTLPGRCPHIMCRYHLDHDHDDPKLQRQHGEACTLDVVDRVGNLTLEETGLRMGVTRERIRQIENIALGKLEKRLRSRLGVAIGDFGELAPAQGNA